MLHDQVDHLRSGQVELGHERVGEPPPADLDRARLAAWTSLASVILNLDETVTKG